MTSIPLDDVTRLKPEQSAEPLSHEPKQLTSYAYYFLSPTHSNLTWSTTSTKPVKIRLGLYGMKKLNNATWPPLLPNETDVFLLKPRRDSTQKPRKNQQTSSTQPQRFVLILYKPFKSEHERKKLSRLIQRTPLIRIRPGIMLAPQIRASRYQSYQKSLLRPSQFIFHLIELGSPVSYASRLELNTSLPNETLENLIYQMFDNRVQRLINGCRQLYAECKLPQDERKPLTSLKSRFRHIRKRLHLLRWQSKLFKEELGVDIQRGVLRATSAAHRVYKRLQLCDT